MFTIEKRNEVYEDIILKDSDSGVSVAITPEKGGMLTSIIKNNREYIYINKDNYYEPGRGHCAVPVLFPTIARTKDEALTFNGKQYKMGIHGLVHSYKWDIVETNTKDEASVTIAFKSNEQTKQSYPFDFEVRLKFVLKGNCIITEQEYINCSNETMPFTFGFHPYFCVSDVDNLEFDIKATDVIDVTDGKEIITPFDGNINFDLVYHIGAIHKITNNETSFKDSVDKIGVKVKYDENFKYVTIWTNNKSEFVCIEPWSSIPNALNTNTDVSRLEANKSLKAWYSIEIF